MESSGFIRAASGLMNFTKHVVRITCKRNMLWSILTGAKGLLKDYYKAGMRDGLGRYALRGAKGSLSLAANNISHP
jgi:hypothetical protein